MGKYIFILLFFGLTFMYACQSSKSVSETINFPQDWVGSYQGKMEMYNPQKGKYMEIGVRLVISESDTVNRWRWQMFYDEFRGKKMTKNYALFRTDSMPKGHFVMDENNGILIDAVFMGNALYECFDVGTQRLCAITRKEKNGLHFEVFSSAQTPKQISTYANGETVDTIKSYPLLYTQKVYLEKKK